MTQFLLGVLLLQAAAGINFFSSQQDIEIGIESAREAEKQLTLVRDTQLNQYIRSIAQRLLTGKVPRTGRFEFFIVNSNDVRSIAFPNGSVYLYRGLLARTTNDAEVAAVIAHEVSHVISRHATSQLSRQLLVQAPVSLSAGLATSDGWKDQLNKLGVVFGINAAFLHYSPDQEVEASEMASKFLTASRFDPDAFDTFFRKLVEASKKGDAPFFPFLYNHPAPENIVASDTDAEATRSAPPDRQSRASLEFRSFQSALQKLRQPPIGKVSQVADAVPDLLSHSSNYYSLNYPDGWQVIRTGKDGAIIAPPEGLSTSSAGDDVAYGVMVDIFDLSTSDKPLNLEQATNRLIVSLRQRNQTVRAVPGAQTPILVNDEVGLRTVLLQGGVTRDRPSIITGKPAIHTEPAGVVWVVTRMYYQNLFYMIFVAPEEEFPSRQQLFEQIVRSVRMR